MIFNNRGVGMLGVLLMILFLGVTGAASVSLISNDSKGGVLDWKARQAFQVTQAGLEYARLLSSQNTDPSVTGKVFGNGTFDVNMVADTITVTSYVDGASETRTIHVNPLAQLAPQAFDLSSGTMTISGVKAVRAQVVCADVSSPDGSVVGTVKMGYNLNGSANTMPNPVAVGDAMTFQTGASGGTVIYGGIGTLSGFNRNYWSTNLTQVKSRLSAEALDLGSQAAISSCLAPYVDAGGNVILNSNQALFLFELVMSAQNYPTNPATNYQDLVMLVTVQ